MIHRILISLFFLVQLSSCILAQHHPPNGTRWALLVAGSRGYGNYRHQADVCHAFQLLKKGGLQEENIIVFMYDDIAFDPNNPRPGVIVNSPNGEDVYQGVPKDYTGEHANVQNLFAVILGDRSNLTGGSGKVLDTGPTDHIFIFYTDHGTAGAILMASNEYVYADELNNVLKRKHEANAYASMVFYLEACESGSMFEGLLPETLNIYAVTASNASESSYATYCPDDPHISPAYQTCLGDLYSVSWMEDSEKHDLRRETLGQQFQVVKHRTAVNIYGSHVMQYGRLVLSSEFLSTYQGTPNHNYTSSAPPSTVKVVVGQREADLLHYQHKIYRAPSGSTRRQEAQKQLSNEIRRRMLIDNKMKEITTFLFGAQNGEEMLHAVRPGGKALVDDWSCLKTFVRIYEDHCGPLTRYGMKYTRAIANACNAGITKMQMGVAAARVCSK